MLPHINGVGGGMRVSMMKVYICPSCGWMRVVSRRKDVECYKCGEKSMILTKMDFTTFAEMPEKERSAYAAAWLYMHQPPGKGNKEKFRR